MTERIIIDGINNFAIKLNEKSLYRLTLKYDATKCNSAKMRPIWQTTETPTNTYGLWHNLTQQNSQMIKLIAPYI
jgi:hypothetical protein